ncbi:unnamed protein product [Lathyrus oleraceus]
MNELQIRIQANISPRCSIDFTCLLLNSKDLAQAIDNFEYRASPNPVQTEFVIHLQQIQIHTEVEFSKQLVLARRLKNQEEDLSLEFRRSGYGYRWTEFLEPLLSNFAVVV